MRKTERCSPHLRSADRTTCVLAAATTLLATTASAGCEDAPAYPASYPEPVRYESVVEVRPETRVVVYPPATAAPPEAAIQVTVGGVYITTARRLDRPTEVVGVIDAHEPSGQQDAAFALIHERAAAMGADAVVGVEFHHGEEPGEPTHLSGLAVRYVNRTR